MRLCGRYSKLIARGKKSQIAVTAIALELPGFVSSYATRNDETWLARARVMAHIIDLRVFC
jgi:hypothetical protein